MSNTKIARNTIYMYIRLFATILIGLYTYKVVLNILGVSDYGLYSVVGGLLAMFTFISSSLEGATTRFLNIELGKVNGDLNRCFNINRLLHILLAIIVLVVSEAVGIWYIYNKLNVAPDKLPDAMFIYQFSIITSCVAIINTPFCSLYNAHERFGFIASVDIVNSIIRLGLILLLKYYQGNSLRLYVLIMSITTLSSSVVLRFNALRQWAAIARFKIIKGWKNYKEVLLFSNWNLLGTVALVARSSGSDLIINSFFGTIINGAFAISKTLNNYITTFSTNFDSASGPQIVQSLSAGDNQRSTYIVNKLGKFSLLLFELFFFPLYIELDFILKIWLGDLPTDVLIFCRLNLLLAAVALTCGGLTQYINASGKLKWFKINGAFFFLICLPIGCLLFKHGFPPQSMVICFLIADIFQRVVQLVLMNKILQFDSIAYIKNAYIRPLIIAIIMSTVLVIHSFIAVNSTCFETISIVASFALTAFLVYLIGLTKNERVKVKNKVIYFIKMCLKYDN